MIKRTSLSILLLLLCFSLHGQLNNEPYEHMNRREVINSVYNYHVNLTLYNGLGQGWRVDTLNYCRVVKSRIKSVRVFKFISESDSSQVSEIHYDSTGMTTGMKSVLGPAEVARIACDSVSAVTYEANRKFVSRIRDEKTTWWTDSSGYVRKYENTARGFVQRLANGILDISDLRIEFVYDSTHRSVTAYTYHNKYFFALRKWDQYPAYRSVYRMDKYGNVLSDFMYRRMEDGSEKLLWGFRYVYEYYM